MKAYLKQRPDRARWVYLVYFVMVWMVSDLPVTGRLLIIAPVIIYLNVTKKGRPE